MQYTYTCIFLYIIFSICKWVTFFDYCDCAEVCILKPVLSADHTMHVEGVQKFAFLRYPLHCLDPQYLFYDLLCTYDIILPGT